MAKTKTLILIISLICTGCVALTSAFAWFTNYAEFGNFDVQFAKIDSMITLYNSVDFNYDGNPDWGRYAEEEATVPIHPLYEFVGSSAALGNQNTYVNISSINITNMMPTQLRVYKLHILNNSDAANNVRITFENFNQLSYLDEGGQPVYTGSDFDSFIALLKTLSVQAVILNDDGVTYQRVCDKIFLANMSFTTDAENTENRQGVLSIIDESYNLSVDSILRLDNDNDLEILLRFELEPLETLLAPVSEGGAGLTNFTQADYEALQTQSFLLPMLCVYLEIG